MFKFIALFAIPLALQNFSVIAQEKTTLYYDEHWKGLDTKKKATYYRLVTFDQNDRPLGTIETFYKSGKPRSKGEAIYIDKLDDSKTLWRKVVIYNEKGGTIFDQSYDDSGNAHGTWYSFTDNGDKKEEMEYVHGNPAKDYYLVYEKGVATKYSFLTMLPMKLATSGKKLIPRSDMKVRYDNGQTIQYYFIDGISVAVQFTREKVYGDYYVAYITIENGTSQEFNINPNDFTAVLFNKNRPEEVEILSYDYYIKKVNRKQSWSAAFNAFAQQQQANQAGYSASTSVAAIANNSGYTAVGASSTQSYNGAAQYAATQNASNNIQAYGNQQYNIKKSIAEGYLKINTVFPSSRVIGYVNIKYQKADHIIFNIPINGKVYQFGI